MSKLACYLPDYHVSHSFWIIKVHHIPSLLYTNCPVGKIQAHMRPRVWFCQGTPRALNPALQCHVTALSSCYPLCFFTFLFPRVLAIPLNDTRSQRRGGRDGIQTSEAVPLLTACWPSVQTQVRCEIRAAQPELFLSSVLHVCWYLCVTACMCGDPVHHHMFICISTFLLSFIEPLCRHTSDWIPLSTAGFFFFRPRQWVIGLSPI